MTKKLMALGLLAVLFGAAGFEFASHAHGVRPSAIVRTADGDIGDGTAPVKKG